MPVFTFTGTDAGEKAVKGERTAENKEVLKAALQRERIYCGQDQGEGQRVRIAHLW